MKRNLKIVFIVLFLVLKSSVIFGQQPLIKADSVKINNQEIYFSKEFRSVITNSWRIEDNSELSQIENLFHLDLHTLKSFADSIYKGNAILNNYSIDTLIFSFTQIDSLIDSMPLFHESIVFSEIYTNKVEYDSLSSMYSELRYLGANSLSMTGGSKRAWRKFNKRHPKDKYKLTYPIKTTYITNSEISKEIKDLLRKLNEYKHQGINHITVNLNK